jgi:hypothetical protein
MATYFPTSNVTIGGSLTATAANHNSVISVSGGTGANWSNSNTAKISAKGQLHLEGEDADLVINGTKLSDILNGITDRLAILQPKPELLEKYANLREAYEHYKTLEALLHEADNGK